ncbi:MAG: flagellar hook-length control protein FliK [Maritimibacter sp.]
MSRKADPAEAKSDSKTTNQPDDRANSQADSRADSRTEAPKDSTQASSDDSKAGQAGRGDEHSDKVVRANFETDGNELKADADETVSTEGEAEIDTQTPDLAALVPAQMVASTEAEAAPTEADADGELIRPVTENAGRSGGESTAARMVAAAQAGADEGVAQGDASKTAQFALADQPEDGKAAAKADGPVQPDAIAAKSTPASAVAQATKADPQLAGFSAAANPQGKASDKQSVKPEAGLNAKEVSEAKPDASVAQDAKTIPSGPTPDTRARQSYMAAAQQSATAAERYETREARRDGDNLAPDPAALRSESAQVTTAASKATTAMAADVSAVATRSDAPQPGQMLDPAIGGVSSAQRMLPGQATSGIQPAVTHPNTPHNVAAQIAQVVHNADQRSVELKLHPVELGKVSMTLSQDGAGGMTVAVTVERADTLNMMRRNIDILAQELRDLGYQSVDFSFQGGGAGQNGQNAQGSFEEAGFAASAGRDSAPDLPQPTPQAQPRSGQLGDSIDIRL